MLRIGSILMAGLTLASLGLPGSVAAQTEDRPARVMSSLVKTGVIVEAVNPKTREVKVIDATGDRFTVVLDEAVTNIGEIQPRDRIIIEYLESVAVVIAPATAPTPAFDQISLTDVDFEEGRPGLRDVETRVVTATVHGINARDRLATLETEDGQLRTIKVADDAPLDEVEIGDQVRLRFTRAIAISVVEPPPG